MENTYIIAYAYRSYSNNINDLGNAYIKAKNKEEAVITFNDQYKSTSGYYILLNVVSLNDDKREPNV